MGEIRPYDTVARLMAIPGHAVALFEVGLRIGWWFHHHYLEMVDDAGQSITLDLAYDPFGQVPDGPARGPDSAADMN